MEEFSAGCRILVFSRTVGYRHDSIEAGIAALDELGERHGFTADATEDPAVFTAENLSRYAAVVFLNTNGPVLTDPGRDALEAYVRGGGGFVGVHSAAATEYESATYGCLVGAHFDQHPHVQPGVVHVADADHPATAHLPTAWERVDEWYDFRTNPRPAVQVLLTVDESSYEGGRMGADHPIAWCHEFGAGRCFYTGLGHTIESYTEPAFVAHLLGGLRYAVAR